MGKKIIITPEQVKTTLNWDYFENGGLFIETGYCIDWDKVDNCIVATWTDKDNAYLKHTMYFNVSHIFGSVEYQNYLGMNDQVFYQKIADYINEFFKNNNTYFKLPF